MIRAMMRKSAMFFEGFAFTMGKRQKGELQRPCQSFPIEKTSRLARARGLKQTPL